MSVLADIREAVADMVRNMDAGSDLNVFGHVPGELPLPHCVIVPADEYVNYQGSFGPSRNLEVRLTARVVYPIGGSIESGDLALDRFLSSGSLEDASVSDALTTTGTLPGGESFTVNASSAQNHLYGEFGENRYATVSAEIPLLVQIYRS